MKYKLIDSVFLRNIKFRRFLYPCVLVLFFYLWLEILSHHSAIELFNQYWSGAVTMLVGSFVAGATPLGGGAVAFPVFTKILQLDAQQAKIFSLFIQSIGMSFACILFMTLNIKINWRWLLWLFPTTVLGLMFGLLYLQFSGHHIKLLLSIVIVIAGALLLKTQLENKLSTCKVSSNSSPLMLITLGFPAGILSALIGTGADALLFFFAVIVFKKEIKQIIPTTIAYMAMSSVLGSAIILLSDQIQVSAYVINSWVVAAPVVAIGAPLGGFIMSKANPYHLLLFIKIIIFIEAISTLLFVNLGYVEKAVLCSFIVVAIVYFLSQLKFILKAQPLV